MIKIGEIVELNDNKKYMVLNKINLHNINYVYLITVDKPVEILIVTEKIEDGEIVLEEIKDNDELDYVLSQIVLTKDEDEDKID